MLPFSHFIAIIYHTFSFGCAMRCYMPVDIHFSSLMSDFSYTYHEKQNPYQTENIRNDFLFAKLHSFLLYYLWIGVPVVQTPFQFVISFQMSIHCIVVSVCVCGQWIRFSSSFFFYFDFFLLRNCISLFIFMLLEDKRAGHKTHEREPNATIYVSVSMQN